ncbi:MAG: MDR family oxidoreductase [Actinomycetota bacterium]
MSDSPIDDGPFRALVLRETDDGPVGAIEELTDADLPDGDVTIDVEYSSLNYKDGLALTGKNRVVRTYPMVPGIDLVGTVRDSTSAEYRPGDAVISTGWMVGERYWGGYSERQRLQSGWLVHRPAQISSLHAMSIGTAGLTAMLCVLALEDGGVTPGRGPVLVTGAAGGVGSVAVALLAGRGYEVVAVTGRPETQEYLAELGASGFRTREEMSEPPRPLESETWAGAVDTVGSVMLAKLLSQMQYGSTVAACGLAGGADLPASVMPFILRNVRLQGVESVTTPTLRRATAWGRLAEELDTEMLDAMTEIVPLSELLDRGPTILAGQVRGRWVVDPHR